MAATVVAETRVEVIFKKGRPVAAFFHLGGVGKGKSGRQIHVRPNMTAHFDASGHSVGLEIKLPARLELVRVNEVLRELGASPVTEADLAAVRMG